MALFRLTIRITFVTLGAVKEGPPSSVKLICRETSKAKRKRVDNPTDGRTSQPKKWSKNKYKFVPPSGTTNHRVIVIAGSTS